MCWAHGQEAEVKSVLEEGRIPPCSARMMRQPSHFHLRVFMCTFAHFIVEVKPLMCVLHHRWKIHFFHAVKQQTGSHWSTVPPSTQSCFYFETMTWFLSPQAKIYFSFPGELLMRMLKMLILPLITSRWVDVLSDTWRQKYTLIEIKNKTSGKDPQRQTREEIFNDWADSSHWELHVGAVTTRWVLLGSARTAAGLMLELLVHTVSSELTSVNVSCAVKPVTTINMNRTHESDDLSGEDDVQEVWNIGTLIFLPPINTLELRLIID